MYLQKIFNVLDRHRFGSKYLQNLNCDTLCPWAILKVALPECELSIVISLLFMQFSLPHGSTMPVYAIYFMQTRQPVNTEFNRI